ncbi:hypothetical protein D3C80_1384920 [compost metagenome]
MFGAGVGPQHAQATDQHRHLGRGERQQLCLVDQHGFRELRVVAAQIVAETVGEGFQHGERLDVGLCLGGVHAAWPERHRHHDTGFLRRQFDAGTARDHDQIGQRYPLAALGLLVKVSLDTLEHLQHLRQLCRLVGFPLVLRGEPDARTVGAAAFV